MRFTHKVITNYYMCNSKIGISVYKYFDFARLTG
jgi:hypothetical protein